MLLHLHSGVTGAREMLCKGQIWSKPLHLTLKVYRAHFHVLRKQSSFNVLNRAFETYLTTEILPPPRYPKYTPSKPTCPVGGCSLESACRNSWSGSDGVSRVRNLVMNGLGMVLPYNRGCGMEWWGGGQCQECRNSRGSWGTVQRTHRPTPQAERPREAANIPVRGTET